MISKWWQPGCREVGFQRLTSQVQEGREDGGAPEGTGVWGFWGALAGGKLLRRAGFYGKLLLGGGCKVAQALEWHLRPSSVPCPDIYTMAMPSCSQRLKKGLSLYNVPPRSWKHCSLYRRNVPRDTIIYYGTAADICILSWANGLIISKEEPGASQPLALPRGLVQIQGFWLQASPSLEASTRPELGKMWARQEHIWKSEDRTWENMRENLLVWMHLSERNVHFFDFWNINRRP